MALFLRVRSPAEPDAAVAVISLQELQRRDFPLSTQDRRGWRPLVFLAVLMSHALIMLMIIRSARLLISSPKDSFEPLVLMLLREEVRTVPDSPARPRVPVPRLPRVAPPAAAPNAPPMTVPPNIDSQREAELAAEGALADAEQQRKYRDLAGLSPEQLGWIERNHMQRMPTGIEWHHPRFEFDRRTGLPVLWLNDHCVLITVMVFCKIGKIEFQRQAVRAHARSMICAPRVQKKRADRSPLSFEPNTLMRGITCPYRPCHPCRRRRRHVHALLLSVTQRP